MILSIIQNLIKPYGLIGENMQSMTVRELIDLLNEVEDKQLPVVVLTTDGFELPLNGYIYEMNCDADDVDDPYVRLN